MAKTNTPLPEGYIRLWTIQSEEDWMKAEQMGFLVTDESAVVLDHLPAYRWMMTKMAEKISSYSGQCPVWAHAFKPDLRKSGWAPAGRKMVRIECVVPLKQVLLSDDVSWGRALKGLFISWDEDEDDELEALYPEGSAERQLKLEESWERIFELHAPATKIAPEWNGDGSWVQATLERVPLKCVTEVTYFIA